MMFVLFSLELIVKKDEEVIKFCFIIVFQSVLTLESGS